MVELAKSFRLQIGERVSSLEILILLSVVCFVNNFIFSAASFMRAHKKRNDTLQFNFCSYF